MHIGSGSMDTNRLASIVRLLFDGLSMPDAAPATIGHGIVRTAADFNILALVTLVLHPCQ
jgi:hypothetical protein